MPTTSHASQPLSQVHTWVCMRCGSKRRRACMHARQQLAWHVQMHLLNATACCLRTLSAV